MVHRLGLVRAEIDQDIGRTRHDPLRRDPGIGIGKFRGQVPRPQGLQHLLDEVAAAHHVNGVALENNQHARRISPFGEPARRIPSALNGLDPCSSLGFAPHQTPQTTNIRENLIEANIRERDHRNAELFQAPAKVSLLATGHQNHPIRTERHHRFEAGRKQTTHPRQRRHRRDLFPRVIVHAHDGLDGPQSHQNRGQ